MDALVDEPVIEGAMGWKIEATPYCHYPTNEVWIVAVL